MRFSGSYLISAVPVVSMTVWRRDVEQPLLLLQRFARVAPANAGICRYASDAPTAFAPSTSTAVATARSGPTMTDVAASSCADVLVEHVVAGGELAEAEVDDPRRAVRVDEDVGAPEVPVRDAFAPQDRHLLPDAAEQLVAPRRGDAVEGLAFDHLVREQQPVGFDRRDGQQVRRAHTAVTRFQREQRFVLDACGAGPRTDAGRRRSSAAGSGRAGTRGRRRVRRGRGP